MPRYCSKTRSQWLRLLFVQYSTPAYLLAVVVDDFVVVPSQLGDVLNIGIGS